MKIIAIRPGYAAISMPITVDMLNGHQTCHGGYIFTLADSSFAFACNSRNVSTVASGCSIDFVAPGRLGDVLTAEAMEQSLTGRTGVYDVAITNQEGKKVAFFRGKSYRINGEIIAAPAPD
jgi:acyl-CoA thioesterase